MLLVITYLLTDMILQPLLTVNAVLSVVLTLTFVGQFSSNQNLFV